MKKHQKHTKLPKPIGGRFHRMEFGFIGAPCSVIQRLCELINARIKNEYSLGFVDANHNASKDFENSYDSIYTDKISFNRLDSKSISYFGLRSAFASHDAVLVNGNHFKADRQIVIINEKKKDSLKRKLDRLDNVGLILLDKGMNKPFDFIEEHLADREVPIIFVEHLPAISNFIANSIDRSIPDLLGLIFVGGKSERMGRDKSKIEYHGKSQYQHLTNLLKKACKQTFISVKNTDKREFNTDTIEDSYLDLGPYGGLLSAFRQYPNSAFLTLPCDAPFIDKLLINQLITNRNPAKLATCFHNPETKFPEPLITIWEPRAYPVLVEFLAMGYSCPRKVLINSDIEELTIDDPQKLFNANTKEEYQWAMDQLRI